MHPHAYIAHTQKIAFIELFKNSQDPIPFSIFLLFYINKYLVNK